MGDRILEQRHKEFKFDYSTKRVSGYPKRAIPVRENEHVQIGMCHTLLYWCASRKSNPENTHPELSAIPNKAALGQLGWLGASLRGVPIIVL